MSARSKLEMINVISKAFGSVPRNLWKKLPNDFRTVKEFGSVLFPLVNVSSILRNAGKDETSCITA